MTVITLPQRASPSWQTGFARYAGESLYPNLWNGLVGAWVPALGPTGLVLRDVSGRGSHGTLTDMDPATDWVVGEKGYALDFDGSNDTVVCGSVMDFHGGTPFSAMVLMRSSSTSNNRGVIGTDYNTGWYLRLEGTTGLRAKIDDGVNDAHSPVTCSVVDNVWHMVGMVLTPTRLWTLLDGRVIGDIDNGSVGDMSDTVVIGSPPTTAYFLGQIAWACVWNRDINPNEIQQLYADPLGMFRRRRLFPVKAPAAGGFQPAWALHANVLIGT